MAKCSHHQYLYNASANGLSAEIERPVQQSVPAQAVCNLSSTGGRGFQRVEKFCLPPFVCFDAAYSEVGGSFDECHNIHTTYAWSVIEGLNIADMVTADKVVSRVVSYSPEEPDGHCNVDGEHSFDITGSYFENLRIAGRKIDLDLSTDLIHKHNTYSSFQQHYHPEASSANTGASPTAKGATNSGKKAAAAAGSQKRQSLLPWGELDKEGLRRLQDREKTYHALTGLSARAAAWANGGRAKSTAASAVNQPTNYRGAYLCSAAGHLDLSNSNSELENFGGIVLIPKFGIVRLAELTIHPDYRRLNMIRVQMCSGATGSGDGPTSGTGGTRPFP
ncbi:MAG TPA: hypothetical protein VE783_12255 [Candidatus Limnocylindrales bacterium]|nr:hypothetical protein [Candidatus Limnocylindrales bacterium]